MEVRSGPDFPDRDELPVQSRSGHSDQRCQRYNDDDHLVFRSSDSWARDRTERGFLLFLISLMSALAIGKRTRTLHLLCGLLLSVVIGTVGCSGNDNSSKPLQETGTKTILV